MIHKILAKRVSKEIPLDDRQRGFRPTDGCLDNITLLDIALRYHNNKFKTLFLATLDVTKAFDSISHKTLEKVMVSRGFPRLMVDYLMDCYGQSTTTLTSRGWESKPIHPSIGVKQGDPLSPMLFNLVIDQLLKRLPTHITSDIDGVKVNAMAFADDMTLLASTGPEFQELINVTSRFLRACGMKLNPAKCLTCSIVPAPHLKKSAVDGKMRFDCDNVSIPAAINSTCWSYL